MRRSLLALTLMAALGTAAVADVKVGAAAPDFTAKDSQGKTESLAQYKGKYVVLEWHNQGCPFVRKQYESGNMEKLQKEWTSKGVVWLSVISSAPGNEGFVSAEQENAYAKAHHVAASAVILDPSGAVGHEYGAKTTPHMFVIDPTGKLIYEGAIDDHPTTDKADIPISKNYVDAALTEAMAGQPVATPVTRPYGCSVKY